jgi:hypothetical protein
MQNLPTNVTQMYSIICVRQSYIILCDMLCHKIETDMHRNRLMINPLKYGQSQSQSYFTTDGQSVSMSWCRAQFGTFDQR